MNNLSFRHQQNRESVTLSE